MKPNTVPSCPPSSLERLGEAFQQAVQREKNKTPLDRAKEQAVLPFHMLRGAARGAIKLLESGAVVTSWLQESNALASPREHFLEKQKHFLAAKELCREAVGDPGGFLSQWVSQAEQAVVDRAVQFLNGDVRTKGEMAGELAPGLAFFILTGKFPGKLRFASKLPKNLVLRKIPLGVKNAREFRAYSDLILKTSRDILKKTKDPKAFTGVRGSSVTGVRHQGGAFGPNSDLDFFVVSDELFLEGRKRGARGRKGMLYVGDTMRFFKKELIPVEKKITEGVGRKATIRIFSQKGFEQIAQGPGKEIVRKPSFLSNVNEWFSNLIRSKGL